MQQEAPTFAEAVGQDALNKKRERDRGLDERLRVDQEAYDANRKIIEDLGIAEQFHLAAKRLNMINERDAFVEISPRPRIGSLELGRNSSGRRVTSTTIIGEPSCTITLKWESPNTFGIINSIRVIVDGEKLSIRSGQLFDGHQPSDESFDVDTVNAEKLKNSLLAAFKKPFVG